MICHAIDVQAEVHGNERESERESESESESEMHENCLIRVSPLVNSLIITLRTRRAKPSPEQPFSE